MKRFNLKLKIKIKTKILVSSLQTIILAMNKQQLSKNLIDYVLFRLTGGKKGKYMNVSNQYSQATLQVVSYNINAVCDTSLSNNYFVINFNDPSTPYYLTVFCSTPIGMANATVGTVNTGVALAVFSETNANYVGCAFYNWSGRTVTPAYSLDYELADTTTGPFPINATYGFGFNITDYYNQGKTETSETTISPTLIEAGSSNLTGYTVSSNYGSSLGYSNLSFAGLETVAGPTVRTTYSAITEDIKHVLMGGPDLRFFSTAGTTDVSPKLVTYFSGEATGITLAQMDTTTSGSSAIPYPLISNVEVGRPFYMGPVAVTVSLKMAYDLQVTAQDAQIDFYVNVWFGYVTTENLMNFLCVPLQTVTQVFTPATGGDYLWLQISGHVDNPTNVLIQEGETPIPTFFAGVSLNYQTYDMVTGFISSVSYDGYVAIDAGVMPADQQYAVTLISEYTGPLVVTRKNFYSVVPDPSNVALLNSKTQEICPADFLAMANTACNFFLGNSAGIVGLSRDVESIINKLSVKMLEHMDFHLCNIYSMHDINPSHEVDWDETCDGLHVLASPFRMMKFIPKLAKYAKSASDAIDVASRYSKALSAVEATGAHDAYQSTGSHSAYTATKYRSNGKFSASSYTSLINEFLITVDFNDIESLERFTEKKYTKTLSKFNHLSEKCNKYLNLLLFLKTKIEKFYEVEFFNVVLRLIMLMAYDAKQLPKEQKLWLLAEILDTSDVDLRICMSLESFEELAYCEIHKCYYCQSMAESLFNVYIYVFEIMKIDQFLYEPRYIKTRDFKTLDDYLTTPIPKMFNYYFNGLLKSQPYGNIQMILHEMLRKGDFYLFLEQLAIICNMGIKPTIVTINFFFKIDFPMGYKFNELKSDYTDFERQLSESAIVRAVSMFTMWNSNFVHGGIPMFVKWVTSNTGVVTMANPYTSRTGVVTVARTNPDLEDRGASMTSEMFEMTTENMRVRDVYAIKRVMPMTDEQPEPMTIMQTHADFTHQQTDPMTIMQTHADFYTASSKSSKTKLTSSNFKFTDSEENHHNKSYIMLPKEHKNTLVNLLCDNHVDETDAHEAIHHYRKLGGKYLHCVNAMKKNISGKRKTRETNRIHFQYKPPRAAIPLTETMSNLTIVKAQENREVTSAKAERIERKRINVTATSMESYEKMTRDLLSDDDEPGVAISAVVQEPSRPQSAARARRPIDNPLSHMKETPPMSNPVDSIFESVKSPMSTIYNNLRKTSLFVNYKAQNLMDIDNITYSTGYQTGFTSLAAVMPLSKFMNSYQVNSCFLPVIHEVDDVKHCHVVRLTAYRMRPPHTHNNDFIPHHDFYDEVYGDADFKLRVSKSFDLTDVMVDEQLKDAQYFCKNMGMRGDVWVCFSNDLIKNLRGDSFGLALVMCLLGMPPGPVLTGKVTHEGLVLTVGDIPFKANQIMNKENRSFILPALGLDDIIDQGFSDDTGPAQVRDWLITGIESYKQWHSPSDPSPTTTCKAIPIVSIRDVFSLWLGNTFYQESREALVSGSNTKLALAQEMIQTENNIATALLIPIKKSFPELYMAIEHHKDEIGAMLSVVEDEMRSLDLNTKEGTIKYGMLAGLKNFMIKKITAPMGGLAVYNEKMQKSAAEGYRHNKSQLSELITNINKDPNMIIVTDVGHLQGQEAIKRLKYINSTNVNDKTRIDLANETQGSILRQDGFPCIFIPHVITTMNPERKVKSKIVYRKKPV